MTDKTDKAAALRALRKARKALIRAESAVDDRRDTQGAAASAAVQAGATYEEVGEAMGLSKQRAHDIVRAYAETQAVLAKVSG